jgi:Tfp pilus assembly protein PilF
VAEDQEKEEEKFDFTPEGEGYISLADARMLAVRTAAESPGDYGRNFREVVMVYEVVESGEDAEYYSITLSLRPQGNFAGSPGQEQFIIGKDGTIAVRQVLSSPIREGGGFPVIPVAIGLVVVGIIAAVGAVFALSGSGGDSVPIAVVPPTETPAPAETPAPTETLAPPTPTFTPMPTYTLYPTPTPRPTYTPRPIPTARVIVVTPTPTPRPTPTKTPRPTPTPNASSYYDKGEEYYVAENWVMAVGEFTNSIQVNPNNSDAYWYRGLSYYNLGQYQNSINDYTKAIQLDPDDAILYNNRGNVYHDFKKYDLAISDFGHSISLDPEYAHAYYGRGYAHHWLSIGGDSGTSKLSDIANNEQAVRDLTKAIELDPEFADAYWIRSGANDWLMEKTGNMEYYRAMVADLKKACNLASRYC